MRLTFRKRLTLHCPVLKDGSFRTILRTADTAGQVFFISYTTSHVCLSLQVHRAPFERLKDAHDTRSKKTAR